MLLILCLFHFFEVGLISGKGLFICGFTPDIVIFSLDKNLLQVSSKYKREYIMKIAMACDDAGFSLKEEVKKFLQSLGHEILDFGTNNKESCDLPDYIYPAAIAVSRMKADHGIFIDGTGYGSALIANKISDLYAVACQDTFCAQLARAHANTNILCLGAEIVGSSVALEIVNTWITTEFCDKEQNKQYVDSVVRLSEKHLKPLFRCEVEQYERHMNDVIANSEKQQKISAVS